MSKYPNLIAEKNATKANLDTLTDHVNVTRELMLEILDGKQEPLLSEASALYGLFGFLGFKHYSFEYLFAPVLATVSLDDNKGKYKMYTLGKRLLTALDYLETKPHSKFELENWREGLAVYRQLKEGQVVTYAAYRNAINWLDLIIDDLGRCKRDVVRDA